MVHFSNLTFCQLKVLFNGLDVVIFYHHSRLKDSTGTVTFRVVSKNGKNLIERCYQPFKLSGRPSRRFVSLESVVNELESFYNFD